MYAINKAQELLEKKAARLTVLQQANKLTKGIKPELALGATGAVTGATVGDGTTGTLVGAGLGAGAGYGAAKGLRALKFITTRYGKDSIPYKSIKKTRSGKIKPVIKTLKLD